MSIFMEQLENMEKIEAAQKELGQFLVDMLPVCQGGAGLCADMVWIHRKRNRCDLRTGFLLKPV